MRQGTPEALEYQTRYGQMNAQHSIQDVFDLLVELITNSDDSYHDLFMERKIPHDGGSILIEIERHRSSKSSTITVSDKAAGLKDMHRAIKKVGDRTSKRGDRGFMGRGLKDCAALGGITIESICDNRFEKAEITSSFKFIAYKHGGKDYARASDEDRRQLRVPRGNGTRVRVDLEPRVSVPQLQNLMKELPWHYALREIMREGGPSKVLVRIPGGKAQLIDHVAPAADVVHDEEFRVPGYPFRARFTLYRAKEPLEDPPDRRFRRTGILVQGRRGIHACTFLTTELERDPAAERYFGRLTCEGIDQLSEEWDDRRERGEIQPAENPILVLDPNRRTGLAENHPFTKALIELPTQVLRAQFEKEREEAKRSRQEVEAKETTDRLKRLAKEASKFMREQLEELGTISPADVVSTKSYIERGVALVPSFTQMRVGDERAFLVRVALKLDLPLGSVVKPLLSKSAEKCLELIGSPKDLEPDPTHEGALRGSFKLRATAETRRVQVSCQVDGLDPVVAEVQVMPAGPLDVEIPGEFSFHRQTYTVRPGGQRTLMLRARFSPPPGVGPTVKLRLADPQVAIVRSSIGFELVPGTTYYEASFRLEGRKLHGRTDVVAESDGRKARCELKVVAREEEGVDLEFKLVPYSLGQNYRAVWDRKQPNRLLITTQHESIRRYLGREDEGHPGQHSPAFRVLLAELISDNVCRRIVEEHARALPHEFDSDKVYVLHNRLMKEFTPIAHRVQLAHPQIVGASS